MSSRKKVLENSFLYIFSSLLVKAIGFLLLPIYTYFLTPEDYGIINLVNGFIQVATFIVAFSLYSAAIRFYAEYNEDLEKLKKFYGSLITFVFISGAVFLIAGLIFRKLIVHLFFEGVSFFPFILISFLILLFLSLHTMHQSILQGMQQGRKLTVINLIVFGFTVLLKLFFIGYMKLGALGVLISQLIVNAVYCIFLIYDLRKNNLFSFQIDIKMLKEALKYSIPLMPHNLSTRIASFASRIFINISGALATVGFYGVALQFSSLIDVIQTAVNKAFQPWFFETLKKNSSDSNKEIVSLSVLLLYFYSLIYMGIGLFSQEIIIIMINKRYLLSWTVIPILVVGFSVKSIYYFYVNILMYYKLAARKIFIATITGSFVDIILAYLLVPIHGMYGAAIAFVFAKILIVAIVVILSSKYNNVGYRVYNMIKIIMPSLFFMAIGLYFSYTKYLTEFNWYNLLYKIIILFTYFCFLYFYNRKIINHFIKSGKIKKILKWKDRKFKENNINNIEP